MLASIRFGYLICLHFKQHIGPQSVSCQIEEENKNKRFTYEMDILMSSYQQRRSPHSFQWWASTRILFRSTKQPLMTSVETTGSCFVAALFQRIVDNSYPHAHFWLPFSDPFCNILHETGRPAGPCKYTTHVQDGSIRIVSTSRRVPFLGWIWFCVDRSPVFNCCCDDRGKPTVCNVEWPG